MKTQPLLAAAVAKRRRGPRAVGLALLLCSLLVPLAFLFDLSPSSGAQPPFSFPLSLSPPQCGNGGARCGLVLGSLSLRVDLGTWRLYDCRYVATEEQHRQEVVLPLFNHVDERSGRGAVSRVGQDVPKKIPKGSAGVIHQHKQIDQHPSISSSKPKVVNWPLGLPEHSAYSIWYNGAQQEISIDIKGQQKGAKADDMGKSKYQQEDSADGANNSESQILHCGLHYVILSKNVLAASVVVNSTVSNSKEPGNLAFHILTDAQNFYAMKYWFAKNSFNKAALHVINYEGFILKKFPKYNIRQLYLQEEFRVLIRSIKQSAENTRMEYLPLFSHSHFLIPEMFKYLRKVVVLDDDVVVQRDLSFLWNIDMGNKVNGAVEFCGLKLGQVRNLLGKAAYDPKACAWMSGVNLINLDKWREHNVTENYVLLMKKFKYKDEASLRAAAFPLSLLSFQHLIYPLDEKLTLAGLGYDYGIDEKAAQRSASLHYNGNMKPWLELGIPGYKKYWKKYFVRGDRFMDECNVNP
ncbi:hypothetical protein PR202_ga28769 [Eleusine coracana subsp. coracana]|uniref:Hexosyltransferase n=1 Tax=Eleusine coracana subsp. coracana TaxID=191504 RepID=A0AAV5DKG8_ELECO|nr:hypothetical protein PR202_ga28769 [Eleusine coracana subsp. coracana]